MADRLTTHALDTTRGAGAAGMRVAIRRIEPEPMDFASVVLDDKGRGMLIEGPDLRAGLYELVFEAAKYHRANKIELEDPPFLNRIIVQFTVQQDIHEYHVPLLFGIYTYTIYRGV